MSKYQLAIEQPGLLDSVLRNVVVDPDTECMHWAGEIKDNGYGNFSFSYNGWKTNLMPHRLVCIAAHGPMGRWEYACHRCDNRSCINPEHLFPGSPADNVADAVMKGRNARGSMLPQTKRNVSEVHAIRNDPRPYSEIASDYRTTVSSVSNIKNLKEWSWLPVLSPIVKSGDGNRKRGASHHNSKLNEDIVRHIRSSKESARTISKRLSVSESLIYQVRSRSIWQHVQEEKA